MFRRIFRRKLTSYEALFRDHYVEVKTFYAMHFGKVPCVGFIGELDNSKAFSFISESFRNEIVAVYQHSWFDHNEQKVFFNNTVFVLENYRMIELAANYCQVLHGPNQYGWATNTLQCLAAFRNADEKEKRTIGFACKTTMN